MALSVVLLSVLCAFVGGFDMEKYLSNQTCADFIVGKTDYFRYQTQSSESGLTGDEIAEIKAGTESSVGGMAWALDDTEPVIWLSEDGRPSDDDEQISYAMKQAMQKGDGRDVSCSLLQIEGLDTGLMQKLQVIDGDITPVSDPGENAIAIAAETDDNGNAVNGDSLPKTGETVTVTYIDEGYFIDSRTGEIYRIQGGKEPRCQIHRLCSRERAVQHVFQILEAFIDRRGYKFRKAQRGQRRRDIPDVLHVRCPGTRRGR